MSITDVAVDDLAEALGAAEPYIVISGTSESLDTYRDRLHKVRSVHDVPDTQFTSRNRPFVDDEHARSQLKDAMRALLADLVEDDMVLCAQMSRDAPDACLQTLDDLVSKLVELSLVHGAQDAAERFAAAVQANEFSFRQLVLIEGIRILAPYGKPIELAPGVELFGLPSQPHELPPILPTQGSMSHNPWIFVKGAVLSIRNTVRPRLLPPSVADGHLGYQGDQLQRECASLPDGPIDLQDLFRSLALHSMTRTYRSAQWCHVDPDDPFGIGMHSLSEQWTIDIDKNPPELTEANKTEVLKTYHDIRNFEPSQVESLRIGLDRWNRSLLESRLEDRIIDLSIAYECVYIRGERYKKSEKLRKRVAKLLAADRQEYETYKNDMEAFYAARSEIVHEGAISDTSEPAFTKLVKLFAEAQEWYRMGFERMAAIGRIPRWGQLAMGSSSTRAAT